MDPLTSALQYVREVKSAGGGSDRGETYHQFLQALNQYRKRNIDSSILISTVQTLFRNNPNLLNGFRHFIPRRESAAAAESTCAEFLNRVNLRSCADFLNRVGTRFKGGGAYRKFLDCMHAYNSGEAAAAAAADEVAGLFAGHNDLVREFARFLPKPPEAEAEAEKLGGDEVRAERPEAKRRRVTHPPEKFGGDGARAEQPEAKRRRVTPPPEKSRGDEVKAAKDNLMEDAMFEIDVRIGRLKSAKKSAKRLCRRIVRGRVSPVGIRLDGEHFTVLDLVSIRALGMKFPEVLDVADLVKLREALVTKKMGLERERARIGRMWNRIRNHNMSS